MANSILDCRLVKNFVKQLVSENLVGCQHHKLALTLSTEGDMSTEVLNERDKVKEALLANVAVINGLYTPCASLANESTKQCRVFLCLSSLNGLLNFTRKNDLYFKMTSILRDFDRQKLCKYLLLYDLVCEYMQSIL